MIMPEPPLSELLTAMIQQAIRDEIVKEVSRIATNETREALKEREEDLTKIVRAAVAKALPELLTERRDAPPATYATSDTD